MLESDAVRLTNAVDLAVERAVASVYEMHAVEAAADYRSGVNWPS